MLAARTIGGLVTLVAALLVAAGVRASRGADASRRASLQRSARVVGAFFCVWLVRDAAELALARAAWSASRRVDLACVVAGALLALGAIAAGTAPQPWIASPRAAGRVRTALVVLAAVSGCAALVRLVA